MTIRYPIIVTDLDGTLLDHQTYSFAAAQPAMDWLAAQSYPLIINTSKTRAEILALQKTLKLSQPFVCENGAAIYLPETDDGKLSWRCQAFGLPCDQWWPAIKQLREDHDYPFTAFADWTIEKIVELTGLSKPQAALAKQREFTQPLHWQGSNKQLAQFDGQLAGLGLQLVQGGRFLSLQGRFDKRDAMQWLREYYQSAEQQTVTVIALGDSANDERMLAAADIAVVIKSKQSAQLMVKGPKKIIRTEQEGPVGWQSAIAEIFQQTF